MKRFWKEVEVRPEGEGWTILLDCRAVKTPARAALEVPTQALADAIADEWRSVDGEIDLKGLEPIHIKEGWAGAQARQAIPSYLAVVARRRVQ